MNDEEILFQVFIFSCQKLSEILQNLNRENLLNDLPIKRAVIEWIMKVLVQQLVCKSHDTFPEPLILQESQELQRKISEIKNCVSRVPIRNIRNSLQSNASSNSLKLKKFPFTLAALHFQSAFLEDGRATSGDFRTESNQPDYLDQLLQLYFVVYSRPLTFNERILNISSESNNLQSFFLRFNSEIGSNIIEKSSFQSSWIINFPRNIFNTLTAFEGIDLREKILDLLPKNKINFSDRRKNHELILQNLKQKQENGTSLYEKLCEAVEITWHRILSEDSSYLRWQEFLEKLDFTPQTNSEKWTSQTRKDLIQGLWFLQGISLYEKLVPGGLLTMTFPLKNSTISGVSIGFNESIDLISLNKILDFNSRLRESLQNLTNDIFDPTQGNDVLTTNDEENKELFKEINNEDVYRGFIVSLPSKLNTSKGLLSIASILTLCKCLCNAIHEQRQLEFQFFIGGASELGRFREIYVFSNHENQRFNLSNSQLCARILRAHYSYFQQLSIGLFLEIESRVHPRVIEIISTGQSMPGFHPLEDSVDFVVPKHQVFQTLTEKTNLIAAHCGAGKVTLYIKGKESLKWPDNDSPAWWIPETTEQWNSSKRLENLLQLINTRCKGNLNEVHFKLITEALLWVSQQSGLGCSLIIPRNETIRKRITNRMSVPLNPAKLNWVESIVISQFNKHYIQNTLIQDGATVLDLEKCRIQGQQLITPIDENGGAYNPKINDEVNNKDFETRINYGTRHTSACDLTKVLDNMCLTITVSADGPITVFYHGEILKLTEMNKAFE